MSLWMDVDVALASVPVNVCPLIDDTDFKSIEASVAYNASGMTLLWNFVTTAGTTTQTAVTPTTSGTYDWTNLGNGMYAIEIPASGGASINNDTEGFGYFTGVATGVLPWRGPTIGFRAAAINNSLIDAGATGLLAPTVAARTLDVTATGAAGIDWGNVENPSATVNLSATTTNLVNTATTVTNQLTQSQIATGVWQDATAGDFTVASSIGKSLYINNVVPGASGGHFISGSNSGTTTLGALTVSGATTLAAVSCTTLTASGAVAFQSTFATTGTTTFNAFTVTNALTISGATTLTGAVTTTNGSNDIRGIGSFRAAALAQFFTTDTGDVYADAVAGSVVFEIADNAGGGSAPTVQQIVDGVWDEPIVNHLDSGSTGAALNAAGSAGDPWSTPLPGAYGTGTAGHIIGTALPDIAPGSANGLLRGGTNAATTFATFTVSGTTTFTGAVTLGSTLGVSGTTTLAAINTGAIGTGNVTITGTLSTSGTTTLNALTVSNALTISGTTTLTGAVLLGSTLGVTGTTTLAAVGVGATTVSSLTVSGTTTLTGIVTATNAGNSITGVTAALATGALTDTAIATSGANRIADTTRRRTQANVEGSAYGDTLSISSLYGFIQQAQESDSEVNPGNLTVYRTDGTTILGTRALETDPAAEPITKVS